MGDRRLSSRWSWLPSVVYGALGATGAIAMYFGLLEGPLRWELGLGGAVVCLVAWWLWHRFRDLDSKLLRLVGAMPAGAAVYLALSAWTAPETRWRRVELPGFSVELPDGEVEREVREYGLGAVRVTVSRTGPATTGVTVRWRLGSLDGGDPVAQVDAAIEDLPNAKAVKPTRDLEVEGRTTVSADILIGAGRIHATLIACGVRVVDVFTEGISPGARAAMHERVVRSVRCRPVRVEEALLGTAPPVSLELPGEWTPGPTPHTFEHEHGGISVEWWVGEADPIELSRYLNASLQRWNEDVEARLESRPRAGRHLQWAGHLGAWDARAVLLPCRGRHALVMFAGDSAVIEVESVLAAARCD